MDLPQRGWVFDSFIDLGRGNSRRCQMCGTANPRYIHVMRHPEYPTTMEVGCECAARMEEDPTAANTRETNYVAFMERRNNWLNGKWRVGKKGNLYRNKDGYRVSLGPVDYTYGEDWWFRLVRRGGKVYKDLDGFSYWGKADDILLRKGWARSREEAEECLFRAFEREKGRCLAALEHTRRKEEVPSAKKGYSDEHYTP